MMEFLGGLVVGGVAGVVAKDKLMGQNSQAAEKQRELDSMLAENEKFRKRNKELERQIEDLLAELKKVRQSAKEADDSHDDLEDEISSMKRELRNARLQNEDLLRQLKESQSACEMKDAEISMLKEKMS